MARQVGVAEIPATGSGKQVIEEKKTTTIDLPSEQSPHGSPRGGKYKNPHISAWFASLPPDERANDWAYSIYRDDSRIIIVEENLDDRASGTMLYKFTPDEIKNFPEGPFLMELGGWVKERFGGGDYHVMVGNRKHGTMKYNKGFKLDGDPILSSREQYKDGMGPLPGVRGESATFLPLIMKVIDEKLSAVSAGKQDGASAFSEVMKAGMEANSQAFKWAMENMPKSADPATQLQTMQFMFNMMEKVFEKREPAAAVNPLDQFAQFATILKTVRDMDRDAHPPAAPAPAPVAITPADGPGLKEIVREAVAAATGARKQGTDWGSFFAQVVSSPAGGSLLSGLGNLALAGAGWVRSRMAVNTSAAPPQPNQVVVGRGGRIRPGPMQPPAAQPAPVGRIQRGSPQQQPADAQQTEPVLQDTPHGGTEQIQVSEEVVQAVLFENALQQIVDNFEHNESGNVVAGAIDRIYPQLAVQLRFMTDDMIRNFIETNPTLSKIKNDPRLPKFLEEFKSYFKEIEPPGEA